MKKYLLILLLLVSFTSCSSPSKNLLGGSEAGNPPPAITGTVPGSGVPPSLTKTFTKTTNGCIADQIIATDSEGTTTTGSIDNTCNYNFNITGNKAYKLALLDGTTLVAEFEFNGGYAANLPYFLLADDISVLNMGNISVAAGIATPQNEPALVDDFDDDGTVDFDDADDNNDGSDDVDEADCDQDGFPDVYDLDTSICVDDDNDAIINSFDNCPTDANPDQADTDTDTAGDACDADDDNDSILDDGDGSGIIGDNPCSTLYYYSYLSVPPTCDDNCQFTPNFEPNNAQLDSDTDGSGDSCEI